MVNATVLVGVALSAELILADFEERVDPAFAASGGEPVHYHSTSGIFSLRVQPPFELSSRMLSPDWRAYEALRLDVFSLASVGVRVRLEDASGRAVEFSRALDPGRQTFELDLDSLGRGLDLGGVARLTVSLSGPECFIDHLRLFVERESEVKLLRAFDFGKTRFRGFEKCLDGRFSAETGSGWLEGSVVSCSGMEWPDALASDWAEGEGVFAVSAPSGIYGVWRLQDAGWTLPASAPPERLRETPYERSRRRWEESVEELVAGEGRVEVRLEKGERLCALAVFPVSESHAAEGWFEVVRKRMRRAFEQTFRPAREVPRARVVPTHEERRRGYIVFRRASSDLLPGRLPGDEDRFDCIVLDCARGELGSEHFAVLPLGRTGSLSVEGEGFRDSRGLPSGGEVRVGWVQYAHKRLSPGSREYTLRGEFIVPGARIPLREGVPRDVWLWVRSPDQAGRHTCGLRLVPERGLSSVIELVAHVAPFALLPDSRARFALRLPVEARAARAAWKEMLARRFNAAGVGPGAGDLLRSLEPSISQPGLLVRGEVDLDATLGWELAPSGPVMLDAAKAGEIPKGKKVILTGLPSERLAWGAGAYSLRARRGVRWFEGPEVQRVHGDPYFDFDGADGDRCVLYPLSGGCLRTPAFEEVCRGIAEFLYFLRLESLCGRARRVAPEAVAEAERFLRRVAETGARGASSRELDELKASASHHITRLAGLCPP